MPIVVCVPAEIDREALDAVEGVQLIVWDGTGDPPAGAADTEFLLGGYMGAAPDLLGAMPRLEVIQLVSAGVERWLPHVPAGVTLCNGRGVHGSSTAELAVAGILALTRRLPFFLSEQASRRWTQQPTADLDEKRLLVLGAGDIGRRAAAALEVFGVSTTYVARTARDDVRAWADVPALLPDTDIVLIAVPLTDDTRGVVDSGFLAALPDGAIVANIARGAVVDTDALLAELTSGRLSAFLDVTEPEPLPADHPLWSAPNVLITPHVAGGTTGWQRRAYRLVREQLARYAAGEPLQNVVGESY